MTQHFVITGNVVFVGDHTSFKVQECDLDHPASNTEGLRFNF